MNEKPFPFEYILTAVLINKLRPLPLLFILIYILAFLILLEGFIILAE
jgi:hypothetical protein